jgi:mRNA interferase MazF
MRLRLRVSVKIERGYLYTADLNPRYGSEPGKLRPVVVIQSDLLNQVGHPSTWVLPCTTRLTPDNILRVQLPKKCAGNVETCDVMIDQSRAIDNQRFKKQLGKIPTLLFQEMVEKLKRVGDLE